MSLGLYSKPSSDSEISSLNPLVATFDGRLGGTINKQIFIHNSNKERWYSDIIIQPIDTLSTNMVDGSIDGYHWKLSESDDLPVLEQWNRINPGNQITLSTNIGSTSASDIVTFISLWVNIKIPKGLDVQTIKDVVLRITAKEYII